MSRLRADLAAGVVAIAITAFVVMIETAFFWQFRSALYDLVIDPNVTNVPLLLDGITTSMVWTLPETVLAVLLFAWLRRRWGPEPVGGDETRCRVCGYILRGLREPSCPECGEWV